LPLQLLLLCWPGGSSMKYKKTTVSSAYGKPKPKKKASSGAGKKKKKTPAHGTRRRAR